MSWKLITATGAALGVVGLVSLVRRPAAAKSGRRRIALIGDSYAVGLGPELAKQLGSDFQYEGHSGISSGAWANRIASQCSQSRGAGFDHGQGCGDWLAGFQPDIVLVSLGVNDGIAPNPANYQAIVRALQGIGAQVVWIEPPADVDVPTERVRQIIQSLGVTTVPATATALRAEANGAHVHPASYSPWSAEIAQATESAYA